MAVTYRIDRPTGIVLFEDDGLFDFAQWQRAVLGALQDPAAGRHRFLSDRRHLTAPPSLGLLEEILGFVQAHSTELGEAQWALLAQRGTAVHDAMNLAEELASSTRVRVRALTDLKRALAWLVPFSPETEVQRVERWIEGTPGSAGLT